MEFALCHPNGAWNYEVAPKVLENLYTPQSFKDPRSSIRQDVGIHL
jgi:hypothetical protein